ncbi:prephenate dehydrogenase [Bifidobacterium dolichotidis]|uniref:Prephenate dehydrogenase n=1 Tax=Bifidobacterium dolichotidis TaxID=2306976 RepID=A0A430FS99_9BIFI|nr:prephenate dehydrogenase/arogenate dehydrogenase family protein [Bifidobacterium dolichotidis]RSX55733.1 prephenate dehydrogenase [Bifidobacterium dolichotidis]
MHHESVNEWEQESKASAEDGLAAPARVGIVGLGLIGGSLALRLNSEGCEVLAWNPRQHPYEHAREVGIQCFDELSELAQAKPDVLVLCNPLAAMPEVLDVLKTSLDMEHTTLTDVGSVKGIVRDQVKKAGLESCYVGAHPMCGNELSGWKAANEHLFHNALWAVTFCDHTDYRRVMAVASMITRASHNRLIILDDKTHDRAAALISHMPHVAATALINMLVDSSDRNIAAALSAGSWRDMTRVALTDPNRTKAMVEENSGDVAYLLRQYAERLMSISYALDAHVASGTNRTEADREIDQFFSDGDEYRAYKAAQKRKQQNGEQTEVTFDTLHIDPENWRQDMLESAKRGEHIVRFTSAYRAIIENGAISQH